MATINGTSGNDTLTTNLYTDDDFFGFAGNDTFQYLLDGGNDTITETSGNDELEFGAGIDRNYVSLVKYGNNLILKTLDHATGAVISTVTVNDHFLSTSNRVETISFDGQPSIDLTDPKVIIGEIDPYLGYLMQMGTDPTGNIFFGTGTPGYSGHYFGGLDGDDTFYLSFNATAFGYGGNDIFYGYTEGSTYYTGPLCYGGDGDDVFHGLGNFYGEADDDTFYASGTMYGGDGDDTFTILDVENATYPSYGLGGTVYAGNDNDTVYGSIYIDHIFLDDGDDLAYGNESTDDIEGGDGNDTIYGGDGDDSIHGDYFNGLGDGNDVLYGGNGNDGIATGGGDDIVYGGNDDDIIVAFAGLTWVPYTWYGNKEIYGEDGNDAIAGGIGDNIISGGDGDDTIGSYTEGVDVIHGDDGNDIISGTLTNGTITAYGDAGDDTLSSSKLWTNLYGGTGNDLLYFGGYVSATNNLYGGTDNDDYYGYGSPSYPDLGTTFIYDDSGAADSCTLEYFNVSAVTFTVSGTNLILTSTEWNGTITIIDQFTSAHRIENFIFAGGGGSLFETLNNSNNNYTATNLTSPIGSHQNFIEALGGIDTINAGIGDDFVWGGTGNDTLNGNADNDTLYGEDDNDTLRGGAGDDVLDGGSGYDTASYSTAPSGGVTVNLATGTATGADGTDTLISMEAIIGSGYADNLTGDSGSNRIEGGNGNDTIYGGADWDYLFGGNNNDTIYGEAGNDTLYGGAGNDTMDGGADDDTVDYTSATTGITLNLSLTTNQVTGEGTDKVLNIENFNGSNYGDTVTGTSGANLLNGGTGNDTLNGGDGNDTLYGGADNDTLNGGNHDDSLSGGAGDDNMDGGSGTDYVRYTGASGAVTVNLAAGTATGEGTDTITNVENVQGSTYNDTITGSSIGNRLEGFDGNDSIYGGDGLDILLGGYGSDTFTMKGETAFNNIDQIWDYTNGTGGDYIDIADVLSDFGYNSLTDTLSDWVNATYSGGNTLLQVDRDGTGGSYAMATITRIDGVNLSLTDLTTDGNLIT